MSTTESGRYAEDAVAAHLQKAGYRIAAQNWRSRWCEIDIVATKHNVIYFVEVKYRKSAVWGDGLAAITTKKLSQMTFAAELWVHDAQWPGDYRLVVASVSGQSYAIDTIIEL